MSKISHSFFFGSSAKIGVTTSTRLERFAIHPIGRAYEELAMQGIVLPGREMKDAGMLEKASDN